jgi:hypothetical protein
MAAPHLRRKAEGQRGISTISDTAHIKYGGVHARRWKWHMPELPIGTICIQLGAKPRDCPCGSVQNKFAGPLLPSSGW